MTYCDHNATTPLRAEVFDAMLPFLRDEFGNPSSAHARGSRARCAVEAARAHVAALVRAQPAEIVFTSGGTEANNLALVGGAAALAAAAIVTTPIEHASVRAPAARLRDGGRALHEIAVDGAGRILLEDVDALAGASRLRGALVSVGWANNEIGTVQPIEAVAARCRAAGAAVHSDAVQAVGKIPVDVAGVDLLSLSAHKLGGPKGVGALYVRRGLELPALLLGGEQERGRRGGTENVAGIVGLGEACRLAALDLAAYAASCTAWRDALWDGLQAEIDGVRRNGPDAAGCLPNTLNVSFEGVPGESLVAALDLAGVAVSGGAACAAGAGEPSHVLLAIGRSAEAARDGVRFSCGRTSQPAEVGAVVAAAAAAVQRIRTQRCARRAHG